MLALVFIEATMSFPPSPSLLSIVSSHTSPLSSTDPLIFCLLLCSCLSQFNLYFLCLQNFQPVLLTCSFLTLAIHLNTFSSFIFSFSSWLLDRTILLLSPSNILLHITPGISYILTQVWYSCCVFVVEISCPDPVFKPHTQTVWDGTSRVGSVVYYQCEEGFYTRGLKNTSECGANGLWEDVDIWCEGSAVSLTLICCHIFCCVHAFHSELIEIWYLGHSLIA